jgi:hypothetical protein
MCSHQTRRKKLESKKAATRDLGVTRIVTTLCLLCALRIKMPGALSPRDQLLIAFPSRGFQPI